MLIFFSIIGCIALLLVEGRFLVRLLGSGMLDYYAEWALGYPLAVLLNALLFFVLYVLGISFSVVSVGVGHGIILLILCSCCFLFSPHPSPPPKGEGVPPPFGRGLGGGKIRYFCYLSLIIIALHAAVYALYLPLTYHDSFSNWHVRSQVQLDQQTLVFEGQSKPQYPLLVHSLQMLPGVFSGWNAHAANAMTLALSLTAFASLYVLTRRSLGVTGALLSITLLAGIPLVSVHLRQGYADIHLTAYILLSITLLQLAWKSASKHLLLLSAVFCAAAAWTKLEGLYFGVGMWGLFVITRWLVAGISKTEKINNEKLIMKNLVMFGFIPLILLVVPWPLLVRLSGMPLSPHGVTPAWNVHQLPLVFNALFVQGSFGVHWYVIVAVLVWMLCTKHGRKWLHPAAIQENLFVWWGMASLLFTLFIFLGTTDVLFLKNNDTFSRTMMISTMLLTQGFLSYACVYLTNSDFQHRD